MDKEGYMRIRSAYHEAIFNALRHRNLAAVKDSQAIYTAITEKIEREWPEPLTWKELLDWDNAPVYVDSLFDGSSWFICYGFPDEGIVVMGRDIFHSPDQLFKYARAVYRSKPREEQGE
jgi:hypothetical protein